jgi:hypothetical protein
VRRLSLLSALVLLLPLTSRGEDPKSPALDEAKVLMQEGLERELPAPTVKGPPQWPAVRSEAAPQERGKLETLGERVRNEASLRARAAAEERRASPENQPGVGQSRTRAAKSLGPPDKKPPRP